MAGELKKKIARKQFSSNKEKRRKKLASEDAARCFLIRRVAATTEAKRKEKNVIKGLIVAAGESKRMGEVKQLLKINGYPLVVWAVMNLRHAGVKEICIVLGKEAERIEEILIPWEVKVVINDKYETNDMLSSVKLGIAELGDADAVFLLPADNPFIKVNTLLSLQKQFEKGDSSIVYPVFAEKKGHPPLIERTLFVDIQSYVQEGGLRQILAMHEDKAKCIPVEDQGIIIDADTQEDFAMLEQYGRKNFGISLSLCDELATELGFYEEDRDQALLEAVEAMEKGKVQIEDGQGCDLIMEMNLAYIRYLIQEDKAVEKEWIALLEKKGYIKVVNRIRKSQ